ncbi:MAG: hypothetical protein KDC44_21285, partial [Phaeodactylibacter sp.]|nr:hypothetical protein [Phaeodactylibacter sp.]
MNFKRLTLTLALVLIGSLAAFAQQDEFTAKGVPDAGSELKEISTDNQSFFIDDESSVYYIDFESINVTLNTIVVKNASGSVVFQENLYNLPVNTIYELDYSTYKPGTYQIELRAYSGVIRKSITVL